MAEPNIPSFTEIEQDGFTMLSSTPEADLRKELETETPAHKTPVRDDSVPEPKAEPTEGPAKKAPAKTPPPTPEKKTPGAPAEKKAAEKKGEEPKSDAGKPEGRVAQLRAEINQLTREKYDVSGQTEAAKQERAQIQADLDRAKADLAALTAQLEEARKGGKAPEKQEPEKKAAAAKERAPEPKEEDFDDFRDWVKAHGVWNREQAKLDAEEVLEARTKAEEASRHERADRERETQQINERKKLADAHAARVAQFAAKNPGFDALMQASGSLPTNPAIDEHIIHSETGPALMQYFAENPEEAERISGLGWGPTLVELGKIEATKLGSVKSGADPERPVSRAHPPVTPVGDGAPVADDDDAKDPSTMEFGPEYIDIMNAREKEYRKRRRL